MATAAQLRAARAPLQLDQRVPGRAGRSLPTQRMAASGGVVRGNVDSLMKLVSALRDAGAGRIVAGVVSAGGGRRVRLSPPGSGRGRP